MLVPERVPSPCADALGLRVHFVRASVPPGICAPLGAVLLGETFTAQLIVENTRPTLIDSLILSAELEDANGARRELVLSTDAGHAPRGASLQPGESLTTNVPLDVYSTGTFTVHVRVDAQNDRALYTFPFEAFAPLALRTRTFELSSSNGRTTVRIAAQLQNTLPISNPRCAVLVPPVLLLESVRLESPSESPESPLPCPKPSLVRVYGPQQDTESGAAGYADVMLGAGSAHQFVFDVEVALPCPRTVTLGRLDISWRCAVQPDGAVSANFSSSDAKSCPECSLVPSANAPQQQGRLQTALLTHTLDSGPVWAWLRVAASRACPEDSKPTHESIPNTRGLAVECVVANGTPETLCGAHLVYTGGPAFPVGPWTRAIPPVDASLTYALPLILRVPLESTHTTADFHIATSFGTFPVSGSLFVSP